MPRFVKQRDEFGLIHVYTGNGKGKTTAALGLALRAIGHKYKACIVQFMKGGRFFGELIAAEKYLKHRLEFAQFGQATAYEKEIRLGRLKPSADIFLPFENEAEQMGKAMKYAENAVMSGKYNLVVLDEINVCMKLGLIDAKQVLELMMSKPKNVELVLTGRDAPEEIKDAADYVVEMREVKHPFNRKRRVLGRRGVEY